MSEDMQHGDAVVQFCKSKVLIDKVNLAEQQRRRRYSFFMFKCDNCGSTSLVSKNLQELFADTTLSACCTIMDQLLRQLIWTLLPTLNQLLPSTL
mmetsp:Transcript_47824/g.150009  ORF Transcript_47824/g.150009 Transcript_47824/m.150009 type:complete len:95 (+) Transcript_47824:767-1051(+)